MASVALLTLAAMQWWLVEWLTPFGLAGFWAIIFAAFIAALIGSFRPWWSGGRRTAGPLMVCSVTMLAWWFVPFSRLWMAANWRAHRQAREAVVVKVLEGSIRPNKLCCPGIAALDGDFPNVSSGGNEIDIEEHAGEKYVFFYTFRGILDNYSGFLFVSGNGDPEQYADLSEPTTELKPWAEHWYWVGHR